MKLGVFFALLLLFGALFAETAPEIPASPPTGPAPPTDPASALLPPTDTAPLPPEPPVTSSPDTLGKSTIDKSNALMPPIQTSSDSAATGYVGEGLYKSKNKKTTDAAQINKDALNGNASNETMAQAARAPPRMQPAQIMDVNYSCSVAPANFSIQLGNSQEMNVTCFSDGAPEEAGCPELNWQSNLGSLNATSNSTAIFTPTSMGNGTILVSSTDGNYSCSALLEVLMGNITAISIFPQNVTLASDEAVQFYVNASDAYGNLLLTTNANWSVQGSAGSINATGFFTATSGGIASVNALYSNMDANATVNVYSAPASEPPPSGGGSGSGGTSSTGGAVGTAAGVSAKRSCAGNPVEATVSEWGTTISGATVSLYLNEGGKRILVSQATSGRNGAATLKSEKEGNYELVASKTGMREGKVAFYLSPCESAGSGSLTQAQGPLSFAEGAGTFIVLEKETINANFARIFGVHKVVDKDGAASYYTDITTSYTNSAQTPLLNFEVAETVPSSVFADVRSLAFTSYPRFSSAAPNTFYWKVNSLSTGQKASYTYRIPRALSAEMISAFAAPSLSLGDEKPLTAKVESTKGNDVFSAVAAFAGTKDVSQLLELAGMTMLALAVLFAAYTFFAGKKSQ